MARVRRCLGVKRVGHLGTLDPAASGVLPVAVGQATRLIELVRGDKAYRAEVFLGVTTDTLDAEGQVTARADAGSVTLAQIEAWLPSFIGRVQQVPPMASALHHEGRRLYELFREGREVALAPREVEIRDIRVVDFTPPCVTLDVACGPGTYIRSLARDLGERLGCGAHLASLVRTQSGPFHLHDALDLAAFEARVGAGEEMEALAAPLRQVLAHLPWLVVQPGAAERVRHGGRIGWGDLEDPCTGAAMSRSSARGVVILAEASGTLLAVAQEVRGAQASPEQSLEWQPVKVLAVADPSSRGSS